MCEVGQRINTWASIPGHYPLEGREAISRPSFYFFVGRCLAQALIAVTDPRRQIHDHCVADHLGGMRNDFLLGGHT
jgi:hypothetical protein